MYTRTGFGRHHNHDAHTRDAEESAGWNTTLLRWPTGLGRPEEHSIPEAVAVDAAVTLPVVPTTAEADLWTDLLHCGEPDQPGLDKYARANYT